MQQGQGRKDLLIRGLHFGGHFVLGVYASGDGSLGPDPGTLATGHEEKDTERHEVDTLVEHLVLMFLGSSHLLPSYSVPDSVCFAFSLFFSFC